MRATAVCPPPALRLNEYQNYYYEASNQKKNSLNYSQSTLSPANRLGQKSSLQGTAGKNNEMSSNSPIHIFNMNGSSTKQRPGVEQLYQPPAKWSLKKGEAANQTQLLSSRALQSTLRRPYFPCFSCSAAAGLLARAHRHLHACCVYHLRVA